MTTARNRRKRQMLLPFSVKKPWGGRRKGAGRKPKGVRPRERHINRKTHDAKFPAHVTIKILPGLADLRKSAVYHLVETAFFEGSRKPGFRLVHFSVQTNHLHLIVEASDAQNLSRGMLGLNIRIARRLNRFLRRKGKVFCDRYHVRNLKSPREVNVCLQYVLNNTRRHRRRTIFARGWIDPLSSGRYFRPWRGRLSVPLNKELWPVAEPRTWLLKEGWARHGPVQIDVRPGPS